jgi:ABC-type transporter Mla maintaining outer membrane lipid asymmetry ATPase subunit MlaF
MPANSPQITDGPLIEMSGVAVGAVQDLSRIVLEEINWTVNAGEFWVIAGMHGSGKTDLLWTTAGIMPPQSGTYRLFGYEMPLYGEELLAERLRLGLAFESGQLFHQLTVHENVALPLRYHRHLSAQELEQRVNAMLETTGLREYSPVMPGLLGRNWQKRAGLARALMLEPEVLLVDRPLGGLDLRHANWWLNFLKQWHAGEKKDAARPRTLIITVEDLRPWRDLDCHFALLKKGRFITLGRRPAFATHQEPLIKELLAEEFSHG